MKNIGMNEFTSNLTRRRKWIAFGVIATVAALAVLWFGMRHSGGTKSASQEPISSVAGMAAPGNPASTDASGGGAELQVDLATDDLKKALIRTVPVSKTVSASNLRVPGIVQPNEYHVVHVTPLVGGVVKQVPVMLGDHVRQGQPLAVIFSSELAEAETQYLAMLAELEADHKKLERTQNLVKLGSASQQEEEEVTASHAAHDWRFEVIVSRGLPIEGLSKVSKHAIGHDLARVLNICPGLSCRIIFHLVEHSRDFRTFDVVNGF